MGATQPPAEQALRARLSAERLGPYEQAAGNLSAALDLYGWNTAISGAFYEDLSVLEVVLRNALNEQLMEWDKRNGGDGRWYIRLPSASSPAGNPVLVPQAREDISKARSRAIRDGKGETPGRVVAELNFGFWRFLLTRRYEVALWVPHLRQAFHAPRLSRRDVDRAVEPLYRLRNRIAHHEPIHQRDLAADNEALQKVVGWISRDVLAWLARTSRVHAVLEQRPPTCGVVGTASSRRGRR